MKLDRSPNNRLQSNELSENDNGIIITSSMQTELAGNIVQCTDAGLDLVSCTKCNITDNIARNCRQGIRLINCSHNRIILNNMSKCQDGLYLDEGVYPPESSNNEIYLNSFSGNGQDVYSFLSENSWSSSTALQYQYHSKAFQSRLGNYWNSGRMRDDNGDGISDLAHSIGSEEDGYPLMGPPLQYNVDL